jgi:calcium/calmodulin-dependent protein kinase I
MFICSDLKPENLLLTSKSDDANLKIADFGFAIRTGNGNMLSTQCGTPGYIAPEILENKPYGKLTYLCSLPEKLTFDVTILGKAVDMWSIGVITYILLGGYPPFHDDNMRNLFKKIRKGDFVFHPEYWKNVSEDAKALIRGLLTVDVNKRLTADDVLKHSWLQTDDAVLAAINLDSNLAEFRKFHATRKFRSAAKAVIAINRMKALLGTPLDDDDDDDDTARPAENV